MPSEKQIEAAQDALWENGYYVSRKAIGKALTAAEQAEPAPAARSGAVKVVEDTYERYPKIIDRLTAAEQAEPATDVEPVEWRTVQKKFYHSEWGTSKLLEARDGGLVTDEGEAWFYEHTSKDGTGGSYDMLFRRVYTRPPESRLREALEEIARSNYIDNMLDPNRNKRLAEAALAQEDGR